MKLKARKSFRPCEVDDEDELFQNGMFVFNITKLVAFLKANVKDFAVDEVAVETIGLTSSNLDESTVLNADLRSPIILAEIAPDRFNVIDGNHRVGRARRDGVATLPAHKVGPNHHHRFLISSEAYAAYVRYWNGKVTERTRWLKLQSLRTTQAEAPPFAIRSEPSSVSS